MKTISCKKIESVVYELSLKANIFLPDDIKEKLNEASYNEESEYAQFILSKLKGNYESAENKFIPVCQDTGMVVVFLSIGQDIHIIDGDLYEAIQRGVERAYTKNPLRLSVVEDPLFRKNTNTNTPAIIHTTLTKGENLEILVCPKGMGSENKSRIKMFNPSATIDDISDFVVETVKLAGASACPPMVIGIGIGGNFEYSAFLAKKALCRNINIRNEDKRYAKAEKDILNNVNALNIGPSGFGGKTTAIAVNIEKFPTHIAGLPVAVNIGCHATRHAGILL
ncbi:MAG: fumarate hydratase [Clostridia bacterium]|nr:fumarate hydratase [Clostridia bacterium]